MRNFFQHGQHGGKRLRPHILHINNQFIAQPFFVLAQKKIGGNQGISGKHHILFARSAALQPLPEIFHKHIVAFQARKRHVFRIAALVHQLDFQTALGSSFGIFRPSERFIIMLEVAGNQQHIMRLAQKLGQIPKAVEVRLIGQRAIRGNNSDVHLCIRYIL